MRHLLVASLALAGLVGCADEMSGDPTFAPEPVGLVEQSAVFVNECDAQGGGGSLGDRVGNFTLQNCYGEEISLHDYCGRRRAIWIIGSAGWCGACTSYVPGAFQEFIANRHDGVELFIALSEDTEYNAPTPEYCFHYAEQKGVDPARVLIDPGFATTWSMISPGGGGSVGLPWEAVLDPYDMSYEWTNSSDPQYAFSVIAPMLER